MGRLVGFQGGNILHLLQLLLFFTTKFLSSDHWHFPASLMIVLFVCLFVCFDFLKTKRKRPRKGSPRLLQINSSSNYQAFNSSSDLFSLWLTLNVVNFNRLITQSCKLYLTVTRLGHRVRE